MGTWLDIVGSFITGSIVILLLINLNFKVSASSAEIFTNSALQFRMITDAIIIENDIYKLGYRATGNKIKTATAKELRFLSDLDDNGIVDSVRYYLGDSTAATSTPNPYDKPFFRKFNNTITNMGLVRNVSFTYLDSVNNVIAYNLLTSETERNKIRAIRLYINVETPEKHEGYFLNTEFLRVIRPNNLKVQ